MAIIERRVFFGKIGKGGELIEHVKKGNEAIGRAGVQITSRVLSDYNSGRTDRVVAEWELEGPGQLSDEMEKAMADPTAGAEIEAWVNRLNELIHHAEVEHWTVH